MMTSCVDMRRHMHATADTTDILADTELIN